MSIVSPWPALVCLVALVMLVRAPVFGLVDAPATRQGGRVTTLDGLRGFLALAVFFHHAVVTHGYIATGRWLPSPSRFYGMLGQVGVAMFFMITGFLFWGKLLAERGRPNWMLLYLGRLFRIGPLYLVAITFLIVAVFARSNWHLNGTLFGLVKACAWWLALGMLGPGPDINRLTDVWTILAGVTWTLQYEWWFYAALLPLALVARQPWATLCCVGGFAVGCLVIGLTVTDAIVAPPVVCATLFLAGMITASFGIGTRPQLTKLGSSRPWLGSTLAVALIAATIVGCPNVESPAAILLVGAAFALIASGFDLFGLLATRAARRLGDMSYGLYLLHGPVLTAVFASPVIRAFALGSSIRYWTVILACGVILVIVAAFAFLVIERPGIALGRRLGRWAMRGRDAPIRAAHVAIGTRYIPAARGMRYGAGDAQGVGIVNDE